MFGFRYIEQESAREDGPLQDRFPSLRSSSMLDQGQCTTARQVNGIKFVVLQAVFDESASIDCNTSRGRQAAFYYWARLMSSRRLQPRSSLSLGFFCWASGSPSQYSSGGRLSRAACSRFRL